MPRAHFVPGSRDAREWEGPRPMHRILTSGRASARAAVGFGLVMLFLGAGSGEAEDVDNSAISPTVPEMAEQSARMIGRQVVTWFRRTPPADRITWGGLVACGALGLGVVIERLVRLRH